MAIAKPINQDRSVSDYVEAYLLRTHGECRGLETQVRPLGGGLDALQVAEVSTRFQTRGGVLKSNRFVFKKTRPDPAEARLYGEILPAAQFDLAPALLAFERGQDEHVYLFEFVRPAARWPWTDANNARLVLGSLALLHARELSSFAGDGSYETLLRNQSSRLVELLESIDCSSFTDFARRSLPAVRRLARNLPAIRRYLLEELPLKSTLIHGDVHSGNVLLRKRNGKLSPVFLDWGRSRHGSPLEDVSSWLQSLGFWEPEARRKHDSLLREYLGARGFPSELTDEIRGAYWLAAACNVLGGAAVYHLSVAHDRDRPVGQRQLAARSLADALRILRRADAYSKIVLPAV